MTAKPLAMIEAVMMHDAVNRMCRRDRGARLQWIEQVAQAAQEGLAFRDRYLGAAPCLGINQHRQSKMCIPTEATTPLAVYL